MKEENSKSDLTIHNEHRDWESDTEMWNYDIEMWKKELKSLKNVLISIEVLIDNHEETVDRHVNEISKHLSASKTHERNIVHQDIKSIQREELHLLHTNERSRHILLLNEHNLLKNFQHKLMILTREFNESLEQIQSCQNV